MPGKFIAVLSSVEGGGYNYSIVQSLPVQPWVRLAIHINVCLLYSIYPTFIQHGHTTNSSNICNKYVVDNFKIIAANKR